MAGPDGGGLGTGFFIRYSEQLFFVTALHNFVNWDTYNAKRSKLNRHERLSIILEDAQYFTKKPYTIDTRPYNDTAKWRFFTTFPDFKVYKMDQSKISSYAPINSIEDYIDWDDKAEPNPGDSIHLVGFLPDYMIHNRADTTFYNGTISDYDEKNEFWPEAREYYLFAYPESERGESGAPVFTSRNWKFRFIGLQSGSDDKTQSAYITKAKPIIDKIKMLTK